MKNSERISLRMTRAPLAGKESICFRIANTTLHGSGTSKQNRRVATWGVCCKNIAKDMHDLQGTKSMYASSPAMFTKCHRYPIFDNFNIFTGCIQAGHEVRDVSQCPKVSAKQTTLRSLHSLE